jgi:hypothetical protein
MMVTVLFARRQFQQSNLQIAPLSGGVVFQENPYCHHHHSRRWEEEEEKLIVVLGRREGRENTCSE